MSENPNNRNFSDDSIEATRKKKIEEFRMSFDQKAVRGEYDEFSSYEDVAPSEEPESVTSYSTDNSSLRRRRRTNEINSYSNYDTKKKIERDSKKALKKQKKEEKKIEKQKAKRNRRIFKWVWVIMVVLVGIVLSQFLMVGVNDMLAVSRADNVRKISVSIPKKPTLKKISSILKENGIINEPMFFELYANVTSSEEGFRQGEFEMETNKDYEAIINFLQSNNNRTDIVTVQITEGMNVIEISDLLKKKGVINDVQEFLDTCNSDQFDEDYTFLKEIKNKDKRYYKLEGYLFPDTYDFYVGEDPAIVVEKLISNFENKVILDKEKYFGNSKKSTLEDEAKKTGYSLDEILTIASIIQAEAANREDMYNISSILHNRLKNGAEVGVPRLNCDCTVYYPYRNKAAVPESVRSEFVSTYDTNDFEGLPPGPICNPGVEAIKAAINPYETDYYYFCHDSAENGSTPYYAMTIYEHEYNLSLINQ